MKIDVILPYKEIFSEESASAVSLTVKNSIEFSKFKKNIYVYGQHTLKPFYKNNFVGIKTNKLLHFSNNLSIVKNYLKLRQKKINENKLIEIHNRPYLFNFINKHLPNEPIALYYHNDATTMKGSKSKKERMNIIKNAAAIIFVSKYIKNQFLKDIKGNYNNLYVLPNGIKKKFNHKIKKQKLVLFVGRLVEEKGIHIFVEAIKKIYKQFPDWKFFVIGASKAGQINLKTKYEKNNINSLLLLGNQAKYLGFIPNYKVKEVMQKSSILVVPSVWDDPFPLTALEGLASGQAVVASERGGLPEMIKDNGILIRGIDENKLASKLKELIMNDKKLLYYQTKALDNFEYDQSNISKKQDIIREKIIKNFFNL
tara:strand:+ start:8833 stop:9939 length:1107 start_codon:yes stop_codon:yes gene_type:complete